MHIPATFAGSALLLRRRRNGYLGVRSAVVHVIASVEADKTLQKAGRHDLSFQLKGFRRADEGTGGACEQTGRILGIDQELTALIHSVMSPETFRVVTLAVVD